MMLNIDQHDISFTNNIVLMHNSNNLDTSCFWFCFQMLIGEYVIFRRSLSGADLESQRTRETSSYTFFRRAVHPYLVSLYITVGAFLMGCAICQSSTDLIKYSIGRLRPHFLAVCEPDWSKITCKDSQGLMIYVEDYECTGDPKHIREARYWKICHDCIA